MSHDDLLVTKLSIPLAPGQLILRSSLFDILNDGLKRKLTLVSTPAGFGKTTLISEWSRVCGAAVAWVSLDESDNDIARFMSYLIAAIRRIKPDVKEVNVAMLKSSQPDSALIPLLNDMSAIQEPFVLVIDDYHLIQTQAIHDAVGLLLEHLPLQAHIVIATRVDPPFPLGRLRGRGQLTELRASDLRFTVEEAAAFLNQAMELNLSAADIATLHTRTEGWITGLQLAAISMRHSSDIPAFIAAFSGSNEYIIDYLADAVLNRQPEEVKMFLLKTSILDRLSDSICEAVTGQQLRLEQIRATNLFLTALDGERHWYRYHSLLAEALRARLNYEMPEIVPTLHQQASTWYEEHGLIVEAIHHSLAAHDFDHAASQIEEVAEATMMRGEIVTVSNWLEVLPDDLLQARPGLSALYGAALLMAGRSLENVETRLQDTISDSAIQAVIKFFQADIHGSEELSRHAIQDLPNDSLFLRGTLVLSLATIDMISGDLNASLAAMEKAAQVGQKTDNRMVSVIALCNQVKATMILGRLRFAESLCRQAVKMAVDEKGQFIPVVGFAYIGLGELMREWNDLDAAEQLLEKGIQHGEQSIKLGLLDGYVSLARVRQTRGDIGGVNEAIRQAKQIAARFDTTEMIVNIHRARLMLIQGDIQAARAIFDAYNLREVVSAVAPGFLYFDRLIQTVLARLLIMEGKPGEALTILEPLLKSFEMQGWIGAEIDALIPYALAFQELGNTDQAIAVLERALQLAEPEGYTRIFLEEGDPMAQLLHQAARRGIMSEYSHRLLAQFPTASEEEPHPIALVEPLSERELEVLQLIAEGLTNAQIAQQLFISITTVKWHSTNIYNKLDVRNRTQAVARARGLGLLPDTPE